VCLTTVAVADEKIITTQVGPDTQITIHEPDVKRRSKTYPEIKFLPGDSITINAGGCVQTGGVGNTWKRYVNPSGGDSDKYYHGLIQIPGATAGLVRLSSVVGQTKTIPANFSSPGGLQLTLGYEDTDYSDNGYWGHDNGTEDQCALPEGRNAWVRLLIHHGPGPATTAAPYDLTWTGADLNGLPLNPRWGQQDNPTNPGLPGVKGSGPGVCSTPSEPPCTTQTPIVMDLPAPWDVDHIANQVCRYAGPHAGPAQGRHVNWGIARYEGIATWDKKATWDDDYHIYVARDDQSAYTQQNSSTVTVEFDSDETIDDFSTRWWSDFRGAVDSDAGGGVKLNDKEVILIGVIGLDCGEYCGSEIHPVLVMAVHVREDLSEDVWAIFARNWGDEGFCSHESVLAPELSTVYLTLPWPSNVPAGPPPVTEKTTWQKSAFGGGEQIQIKTFPFVSGAQPLVLVVEFDLGDPDKAPMVNGELHLNWTAAGATTGSVSTLGQKKIPARTAGEATREARAGRGIEVAGPEPEDLFAKLIAGQPEGTRKKLEQLKSVRPARPRWVPAQAANLRQPPSDFQAKAFSAGRRVKAGTLGRIQVVPNSQKKELYEKAGQILKEGGAKLPPPQ